MAERGGERQRGEAEIGGDGEFHWKLHTRVRVSMVRRQSESESWSGKESPPRGARKRESESQLALHREDVEALAEEMEGT